MKKNSKYIVLTAAIALCAGSSLPFLAGSSTLNPERDSVKSEVPYCVTSPSVPDKITFAGQAIDLLRYDHRERMDRELMSFTYMHSTTMLMVKRANRYFPVIEPILKANGLPDDFKYLAVIESNLNPLAKSPAGAAGLWQFMPATGREFGLEVNSNIDERYHIEKETKAACKYLKDAYQKYAFIPVPALGILGCAVCGLSVGIMWPGTFSMAAASVKRGGTALFALLALAGDVGCSSGPTYVGMISGALNDNLKLGIFAALIFPVLMIMGIKMIGSLQKYD